MDELSIAIFENFLYLKTAFVFVASYRSALKVYGIVKIQSRKLITFKRL